MKNLLKRAFLLKLKSGFLPKTGAGKYLDFLLRTSCLRFISSRLFWLFKPIP